jgi:glycosyltransferase involved in cell wall biosynthesis
LKRQHLLIEAMRHVTGSVRLIVAGPPQAPADATLLLDLVRRWDLEDRVTLMLDFLPRAELARLVNHASAVAYIPFDEDSVGYVTMEACSAGKPVITTHDSGGVLDLIVDQRNGLVAAPEPPALAEAIVRIQRDSQIAARWGQQGRQDWLDRGVTWPRTIDRLLS